VPEIKEHAWYTRPLLPRYEAAEADIAKRQADVEAYIRRRDLNIVRAHAHARTLLQPAKQHEEMQEGP
jgi:hypothetical protein